MESLLQEKEEIEERVSKLQSFVVSERVRDSYQEDIDLIYEQLTVMNAYSRILQKRIDLLK